MQRCDLDADSQRSCSRKEQNVVIGMIRSSFGQNSTSLNRAAKAKVLLCVLAIGVSMVRGQWLEKKLFIPDSLCGLTEASGAVYDPVDGRVYVAGGGPFLIVIDGSSLRKSARIDLPGQLSAVTLDGTGTKLYGIDSFGGSITVVDLGSGSVKSSVPVGRAPTALCYNVKLDKLFCSDYWDRQVYVIDCGADTALAPIPAGNGSLALCFDTSGTKLYVANQKSNSLSIIDAVGDSLLKTLAIGSHPEALCSNTQHNKVYCFNYSGRDVAIVDAGSDSVLAQPRVGINGDRLCYNPIDDKVYCGGVDSYGLCVLSGSGDTVLGLYPALGGAQSLLHTPTTDQVYCALPAAVFVLDGATDSIQDTLPVDVVHYALAHQASPNRVWCAGEEVVVLDGDQDTVVTSIPVGCRPASICYSPKSRKLYVGYQFGHTGYSGFVTAIDATDCAILRSFRVPHLGPELCYNSAADKIYTGNNDDSVNVISCEADSVIASIAVGSGGDGRLCSNALSAKVYCTDLDDGHVRVIDALTDSVVKTTYIGFQPNHMCYNPINRCLYVSFLGSGYNPIAVVDSSDSVVTNFDAGAGGEDMVFNPVNNGLYCIDRVAGGVAMVDCGSNQVRHTWQFDRSQFGAAVDTRDNKVYLTGNAPLWTIDGVTNRTDSVPIGNPELLGAEFYNAPSSHVYCASSDWVYVVDGRDDSVLDSFDLVVFNYWRDVFALDSLNGRVYGLDDRSQVFIIRDSTSAGIMEAVESRSPFRCVPTHVRGTLLLPVEENRQGHASYELLNVAGRRVTELRPGPNDIRALAPGVYFVRSPRTDDGGPEGTVRKVVIAR